jgi:hypothetical protein
MDSVAARIRARATGRKTVEDLYQDSSRVYFIHYACESFEKNAATGSVKVVLIAIRNLHNGQTKSWSILKSAELDGCFTAIPSNINRLEKIMLDGFFGFLNEHPDCRFVHWNMRDDHFGFSALEHRHRALGGVPFVVRDGQKVDLSRLLWTLYGDNYASHTSKSGRPGRIFSLVEMNNIGDKGALSGDDEPKAFESGDHLKMQQSTLRKLEIFSCIFELVHRKKLKTEASWLDVNGLHPAYILDSIKRHWIVSLFAVTGTVIGALLTWWKAINAFFQIE